MSRCPARAAAALSLLLPLAGGCELREVSVPAGQDRVIVEAVLRAGEPVQRILLHRTVDGPTVRGEPDAEVTVTDGAGGVYAFGLRPLAECIASDTLPRDTDASCYASAAAEPSWVRPGETYELAIRTPRGERVGGRTTVPADFRLVGVAGPAIGGDRPRCTLSAQRGMRVEWTRSATAASYLSQIEVHGLRRALEGSGIRTIPEPLKLTGASVTADDTGTELPASFGIFERFDLDQDLLRAIRTGFPSGVRVELVVAAIDRNLANAIREDGFGPTGETRTSSITGDGSGVFASIVPVRLSIEVDGDTADACPS